ncbi:MAG: lysophospholipase [Alphaproteobacteria bacterium]|nr:lysophospholipase [Alphaproteobacteria bacterium]
MRPRLVLWAVTLLAATAIAGCAPTRQTIGAHSAAPRLTDGHFITGDGVRLPYRAWLPRGKPKAVVLAVHGMNEHSRAFAMPAANWRTAGIATYAYDQRGFGGAPQRGIWPGREVMVEDLKVMARLVRARHPGTPIYLLGVSMGGAVVIAAIGGAEPLPAAGAILVAPAVWGRKTMPVLYPPVLWLAAHTVPWIKVTGDDISRVPSDNTEMLRDLSRDPRVIKATRVDAIFGVVGLMDSALAAAANIRVPILLLYGEKDRIIPRKPTLAVLKRLPAARRRVALYREGWHMLLRDLQRAVVHRDVAAWITDRSAPLPSGADRRDIKLLAREKD